jgi:hypothetical protein
MLLVILQALFFNVLFLNTNFKIVKTKTKHCFFEKSKKEEILFNLSEREVIREIMCVRLLTHPVRSN